MFIALESLTVAPLTAAISTRRTLLHYSPNLRLTTTLHVIYSLPLAFMISEILYLICGHQGATINMGETPGVSSKSEVSEKLTNSHRKRKPAFQWPTTACSFLITFKYIFISASACKLILTGNA